MARIPTVHSSGTLLVLYGPTGLPFYSGRDLTQTIEAIKEHDQAERNVNGNLVDLSIPGLFEKYVSKITCTDMNAPSIDGVWQGMQVVVDCCAELSFKNTGISPPLVPDRPLAAGTTVRDDGNGTTFYYPRLTCLIRSISFGFQEYPHKYNWALGLEEI